MATASPSSASESPAANDASGRGQTSPLAALVAVATVCLVCSLYATVLDGAASPQRRNLAEPTLERVHKTLAPASVAKPGRLDAALDRGPNGYGLNVSLVVAGQRWTAGARPPPDADRASRRVAVRVVRGRVRPGTLRVAVWR